MIENGATHINCIVNDYIDKSANDLKPQLTLFKLVPAVMSVLHIFRL